MFNAQAPFFVVLSFVLFFIAYLGSTASYFEVHISSTGSPSVTGQICPNYTPVVGIEKYYSTVVQASVFRFYCEEDADLLYDPGHWTTTKVQASSGMRGVMHECSQYNTVVAGARLTDGSYGLLWSFYCSTLGSGWRIASDQCSSVTLGSSMDSSSSASGAFVSLVDRYNPFTFHKINYNEWILKSCKIIEVVCSNITDNCNHECCEDIRINNSKNIRCNGSDGLIIECLYNFYWTGDLIMCSNDIDPAYHYCKLCYGSSFIRFCETVYCSTSGYYKCQVCFKTHPKTGWPLVPNKNAKKCRTPGRVTSFQLIIKREEVDFCFGYYILCTGVGQYPLTILLYDVNNPTDNHQVYNVTSTLVPICLFNHTFACMISNKHGNETKYVSIRHSITPIVLDPDTTITVCEGANASLSCITQGSMYYIEWYYIGILLTNDTSNYSLLDERGILLISSAHKDNIGSYECKVWNGLGKFEKFMWLSVESFPSCGPGAPL